MKQVQSKLFVMLSFMFFLTMRLQSHARPLDDDDLYPVRNEKSNSVPTSIPVANDPNECACASSTFSQLSPTPSHPYEVKKITGHSSEAGVAMKR